MHRAPWWVIEAFDRMLRPLLYDADGILSSYVAPGDRVADIGCGTGYHSAALSRLVGPRGEVVLVDVQQSMLERAMRRSRDDPVATAAMTGVVADAGGLNIPGEIDFALLWWTLHEIEDPAGMWRSLAANLRPAAKVLVTEPYLHVSARRFEDELAPAAELDLKRTDVNGIFFSYAAVLTAP